MVLFDSLVEPSAFIVRRGKVPRLRCGCQQLADFFQFAMDGIDDRFLICDTVSPEQIHDIG